MRRKHRELMRQRRISDDDFLQALRVSERQVYEWHRSRPREARSSLLNVYFGIFRRP